MDIKNKFSFSKQKQKSPFLLYQQLLDITDVSMSQAELAVWRNTIYAEQKEIMSGILCKNYQNSSAYDMNTVICAHIINANTERWQM